MPARARGASIGGREHLLTTGDVLVAEAAIRHDISAEEASVLLVTVAAAGTLKE
jgi:quercetin dioxygenase-like cupin family protein